MTEKEKKCAWHTLISNAYVETFCKVKVKVLKKGAVSSVCFKTLPPLLVICLARMMSGASLKKELEVELENKL